MDFQRMQNVHGCKKGLLSQGLTFLFSNEVYRCKYSSYNGSVENKHLYSLKYTQVKSILGCKVKHSKCRKCQYDGCSPHACIMQCSHRPMGNLAEPEIESCLLSPSVFKSECLFSSCSPLFQLQSLYTEYI